MALEPMGMHLMARNGCDWVRLGGLWIMVQIENNGSGTGKAPTTQPTGGPFW